VIRVHRVSTVEQAEQAGHHWWVDRDYRWHEAQARQAWQDGIWFAADFHLKLLQLSRPWDASLAVQRSHALREQQLEKEATIQTVQALLLDPRVRWELPPSKSRLVMPRAQE
jgi:hypothetical protein